jgi:hypothetical protein
LESFRFGEVALDYFDARCGSDSSGSPFHVARKDANVVTVFGETKGDE